MSPQVKNPHLGPKLRKLGLTPETAFGCVTEFLFPPRSVIFDGVAAERRALLGGSGNSTLRIGIQASGIRSSQNCIMAAFLVIQGSAMAAKLGSKAYSLHKLVSLMVRHHFRTSRGGKGNMYIHLSPEASLIRYLLIARAAS